MGSTVTEPGELTERFAGATISSGRVYTQLQAYCLFTGDNSSDACSNALASASNSSVVGDTLSYTTTNLTNASATAISPTQVYLYSAEGLT